MTDPANPHKPPRATRAPEPGFPVSGRCVEITTDENGSIQIAFVPVDPKTAFITTFNQPEKGKLP
jgi:hypothetical protein